MICQLDVRDDIIVRPAKLTISNMNRPLMCMSRKHMACSAGARLMGMAKMANKEMLFVMLVDCAKPNDWKHTQSKFRLTGYVYELFRGLDVEIW